MKIIESAENALAVDRLEKSLFIMSDIYRKHRDYIRTKHKISSLEMEILQLIILDGPKKMKEIGKHFNIKLSTLTSIIDKVEKQKLVQRNNSRDDRRVVFLEVTRKGRKVYEDYSRYIQAMSVMMSKSLGEARIDAFLQGIDQISPLIAGDN